MTDNGGTAPTGWASATLGDLGVWSGGGTPSKAIPKYWNAGSIPWVSPKDMKADVIHEAEDSITVEAVENSAAKIIPANSLLMVTRSGILAHTFPVAINRREVTVNQDLKTLTTQGAVVPEFLAWFLRNRNAEILATCSKHGTTVASIDTDRLKRVAAPIPPLAEQRRIVEKIETLFARLDKGEEAVRTVQSLLERYRQSVLKAAVTGAMTADWRATNAAKVEHGSDVLARILKTRRETWAGRGRYHEPVAPDTSNLHELPEGWAWACVDQLLSEGLSNGRSVPDGKDGGFPVLRLTALKDGSIDITERKIGKWTEEDATPFCVARGDILVSRGNGSKKLVGLGGIVRDIPEPVAFPDTMIRIPLNLLAASPHWFVQVWNSPFMRAQIEKAAKTTAGIHKINQGDIRGFYVPVPPITEQDVIATRVKDAASHVVNLETWCVSELGRSTALRQSILKDAFTGRLVPQDAFDEPASALLDRIRSAVPAKKTRTRR